MKNKLGNYYGKFNNSELTKETTQRIKYFKQAIMSHKSYNEIMNKS